MRRRVLAFVLVYAFCGFSAAPIWAECVKGDCVNGQGTDQIKTGSVVRHEYSGSWQQGRPHGRGTIIHRSKNGIITRQYSGEWVRGLWEGTGTLTVYVHRKLSRVYEGQWKKNGPHGLGKETVYGSDGKITQMRTGTWRDGRPDRQGHNYFSVSVGEGRS